MLWHAFWCLPILHLSKKTIWGRVEQAFLVQLSQLSTPAFSTLLWKNSSHLRIRLTCTCFEDSSVWAWNPLLSRSTRAFVLIAYSRAKHARSFMRALIRSIVCPYLCSSDSRQLSTASIYSEESDSSHSKISLIPWHHLKIQYCNKVN